MNRRFFLIAAASPALAPGARAQAVAGRTYSPGNFDSIDIAGSAVVRFVQGATDEVFVEGADAAQEAVDLQVRHGMLTVRPGGSWMFWNSERVRITVTARELSRLVISGAADFRAASPVSAGRLEVSIAGAGLARFDQLKAERLAFHVAGAGDGQVAGVVRDLDIRIAGRSEFRGEDLMSERARVRISGLGKVMVWASKDLDISVAGIGSVDYWGSPSVERSVSGRATITDRGAKRAAS